MSPFNLAEYEPVENRIRDFWEQHPMGRIVTELLENGSNSRGQGFYIVKALVYRGDELREGPPAATGLAQEMETERGVNSTSALENCETSAIGRALANLGYAAKGKRPSREEMSKVSGGDLHGEGGSSPDSTSGVDGARGGRTGTVPTSAVAGLESSPRQAPDPSEIAKGRPSDEAGVDSPVGETANAGESPANHLHGPWSDKRPDGAPMRDGWLRCEGCGQASLRKSVA